MKLPRLASLLAFAAMPAFAFAAGSFSVSSLNGQARTIVAGETSPIKVGSTIEAGVGLETNTASSTELTLPNGVKVVLSPGTRISIKQLDVTSGFFTCDIVLLRGSFSGDATGASAASSFTVRTSAGVVNVAGGAFSLAFSPSSSKGGDLNATSTQGSLSVMPVNGVEAISVPAGSQLVLSGSGASHVSQASPNALANAKAVIAGLTPPSDGKVASSSGLFGDRVLPNGLNLALISPNGEGSSGL